jgi:hypothetical protein
MIVANQQNMVFIKRIGLFLLPKKKVKKVWNMYLHNLLEIQERLEMSLVQATLKAFQKNSK